MKGYFVLYGEKSEEDRSGIGLKVRNQIKALNNAGLNCEELVLPIRKSRLLSILYRLPFFNVYPVWTYREEFNEADYLYMRRPFVMNGHMRRIFRKIRQRNPKIKIIVEIPTYPYDEEYDTYKMKQMLILKDKYNRIRMKGLVDYYANLTEEKEIFGIPTIKIWNGINVDEVQKRIPEKQEVDKNTIHMCAIAMFKEWHGYERFLVGLNNYYCNGGERNIICHFVGEGSELSRYKDLVSKYSLEEHVIFHGFMESEELNHIYNISTISLGSFGMYKIKLNLSCNLKSREAVARGIPMVTGCPTDIFQKDQFKYYLEFPNDASVLDIQKIIDFHDEVYQEDEETVVEKIRDYAKQVVDMNACMRNVISYFKE